MGFLSRLFGSGKQKVTPEQMAAVLLNTAVQSALQGDGSVYSLLEEAGVEVEKTPAYKVELIIYQLFLLDVLVHRTFDEMEDEVRKELREVFAEQAVSVVERMGGDPRSTEEYMAFLENRFQEYFPAAKRSLESEGQFESGAMALAETVYRTITGEEPGLQATMALTVQWTTFFSQLEETLEEEYEIVSA